MMYHHRMRTTIDLPPHLLVQAKKLAAERHVSLTRVVEESVRAYLTQANPPAVARLPLPLLTAPEPQPGVDLDDTSRLWEIE